MAQRVSSGRVLSVENFVIGGQLVWRVKIVTAQGDVRLVLIDAVSGRLA